MLGSYLPKGCEFGAQLGNSSSWLRTEECDAGAEFGLEPCDFDVIFAYPWPADEDAIAGSNAFSLAGGGDTLAAIAKYGVGDRISYLSTGGGAFLEFLEGKTLPAIAALEARGA